MNGIGGNLNHVHPVGVALLIVALLASVFAGRLAGLFGKERSQDSVNIIRVCALLLGCAGAGIAIMLG